MQIVVLVAIFALGILGSVSDKKPEVKNLPPIEKALEKLEPTSPPISLPCGMNMRSLEIFKTDAKQAGFSDQEIATYLNNDCASPSKESQTFSGSYAPLPSATTTPSFNRYDYSDYEDGSSDDLNSDSYQTTNESNNFQNDVESDVNIYKSHGSTSYQRIGNFTYGSDGSSYQKIGNFTYGNDGSSYQKIGNFTYGSDGTNYQKIGNFTYGSDGTNYQKIGNFTYGSDGTSSQKIGNTTYVNPGY